MRTWGQGRGLKSFDEITCKANGTSLLSLSYEYDAAGNITKVYKSGVVYNQYAYDELGQLIREDNKDANKSYTYTYDSRGNILEKKTYAFTLGTLGTAQKTDSYGYATDSWKDRLTSYNGQTITYDAIGNPLTYNNGTAYTFTWEGRQMQTATKGGKTWSYTYNSDGLRTSKTNGSTIYSYTWNENRQLSTMVCGTSSAWFYYDHEGKPLYMEYADGNDECSGTYRYILNLQGDVVGLYDLTRDCMAMTYTYDAWGRELSWSTLNSGYAGLLYGNPLTYRGYIYDRETGFYYLQSRYYDPTIGRFLNADDIQYLGASGTLLSLNLFVYCENDPVNLVDSTGTSIAVAQPVLYSFLAWLGTLGASNFWNPIGWIIAAVVAAGVITWVAMSLYKKWEASAASKTRTLRDVKEKDPPKGRYYFAYINKKGELEKSGNSMTFTEALVFLGIKKASASLSKRYKVMRRQSGDWGIYTTNQADAKSLAVVLGCTAKPEVHGSGYYGHYHDANHVIHIWFGYPIVY